MGKYAKLKHGSKELDLSGGDYCLMPEFTPPPPAPIPLLTGGNMLNRYAGGRRVDRSFSDRPMNVPLVISGDSAAETHGLVRRLVSFIESAMMDSSDPLYFVYGESDAIPYEPKWGQQFKYYEIKDASQAIGNLYGIASIYESLIFVNLPMLVGPFAVGKRQLVGSATGSIRENTYTSPDGISRGTMIPEASTNKMTNPIFGHSTYNNGWTGGADTDITENTDDEYIIAGSSSARYVRTGNTAYTFTQSIDAGNTNDHTLSCYVKKQDGSAVTSSDVVIYYGASKTTTYTAVGDGWYRIHASFAGISGATATGIAGASGTGKAFYVDGFHFTEEAYMTPLVHGDMLDCVWNSTDHESTSSSTAARWRIDGNSEMSIVEGCIRFVWLPDVDSTSVTGNRRFFATGTSGMAFSWIGGSTQYKFEDGTNNDSSANTSFTAGVPVVFHCVYGFRGFEVFINGVLTAIDYATYTPQTIGNLYVGSSASATEHINGTFLDLTIFDRALTAAEILDDYNNISDHVNGGDGYGQRINPIPWLWTYDGDNVLDSYCDSTHENYCVYGGIPGNIPADTIYHITPSATGVSIFVSNFGANYYVDLSECFSDLSGHVDAGALGGEVEQLTATTTAAFPFSASSNFTSDLASKALDGLNARFLASISDAGSNLYIYAYAAGGNGTSSSSTRSIVADATRKYFVTYETITPVSYANKFEWLLENDKNYYIWLGRTTGSAVAEIDYTQLFLGDFFTVENVDSSNTESFIINGRNAIEITSAGIDSKTNKIIGDTLDLYPNKMNHVVILSGTVGANTAFTRTVTITRTYTIPRWSIL